MANKKFDGKKWLDDVVKSAVVLATGEPLPSDKELKKIEEVLKKPPSWFDHCLGRSCCLVGCLVPILLMIAFFTIVALYAPVR